MPNLKFDGYFAETDEVFEYLGCLSHGCLHSQSTQNHWHNKKICRAGMKKLKRGCRKLKMPVMWFVSIWGPNFGNHLRENPGLENALSSHPYVKNSPINIRGALYGGTTEATKTYYRVEEGEKIRYVVVVRLFTIITIGPLVRSQQTTVLNIRCLFRKCLLTRMKCLGNRCNNNVSG